MSNTRTRLDTTFRYETPEGIELELRPAGPVVRGLAWGIDLGIRAVVYILVYVVASIFGGVGTAISLIFLFLVEWFYPVIFEIYKRATPGKSVLGLEVMQADGSPLSWSSSLLRNLLRTADFFPFLYCSGFISMMLNNKFQRLGDLAADTVVVFREARNTIAKIPAYPPKPSPYPLSLTEQRLILDFAERAQSLSAERRSELADLLFFLTSGSNKEAELTLLAYANWFARGR
ncbi:MAG TPA: RDD family protein [Desulfobacterales bacterium]|nr:RDD family protein [Desulfobacterales bacterium]